MAVVLLSSLKAADSAGDGAESHPSPICKGIFESSAVLAGLCLHLGCGSQTSPALTAELAQFSRMLVHGLALDDAGVGRARDAIESRDVAGRAMAERFDGQTLPYLNDLANLVVVEDLTALKNRGVGQEEILRITAPGGTLCVFQDGKWTTTVKPRPKEMDVWTHPHHGADGNVASTDKVFHLPIGYRWLDGFPTNVEGCAATRGVILTSKYCISLSINERENLHGQTPLYLHCRDAFNGLTLWKLNTDVTDNGWSINWDNEGALCADENHVYTSQKGKLIGVDTATGQIVMICETRFPPTKSLVSDGVVVASCWAGTGTLPWSSFMPKGGGSVEAFDAESGKALWTLPSMASRIVASDGALYLVERSGEITPEKDHAWWSNERVIAVDIHTGKEKWSMSSSELNAQSLGINNAGKGFVVVTAGKAGDDKKPASLVLSAQDGKLLWKGGNTNWSPLVDGQLWLGDKRDPITGVVKGKQPFWFGGHGCQLTKVVGNYLVGGTTITELEPDPKKRQSCTDNGTRTACVEGFVPGNGLLYSAQVNCTCVPSNVYGFVAVGPTGEVPSQEIFEQPRAVEKGPAFGAIGEGAVAPDDWPAFRHDAERTSASSSKLPPVLKEIWRAQIISQSENPLEQNWNARLTSPLSAPVVAGGTVFVATANTGRICAFDAASGKAQWSVLLGSRMDTPPTIYKGVCLIGCHDGYLYALRAKDGQNVWRIRVAPAEKRMVAYGLVESIWPVIGTVLIHDDVAYVSAGRTSESDGGVVILALEPHSGKTLWAKTIGAGAFRTNDLLAIREGHVAWNYLLMDPKTGAAATTAVPSKELLQGAMVDPIWNRTNTGRSGHAFRIGMVCENLLAWNESLVAAPGYAIARARAERGMPPKNEDHAWRTELPRGVVSGITIASNGVLYAVRTAGKDGKEATGLTAVDASNGKKFAETTIEGAPTCDGVIVAGGRVYLTLQNGALVCLGQ